MNASLAFLVGIILTCSLGFMAPRFQAESPQAPVSDKIVTRCLEIVDAKGQPRITAQVRPDGVALINISAGSSSLLIGSTAAGSLIELHSCGQRRAYWATEVRKAPNGSDEAGITELCFFMPMRDPKTLEPVRDNSSRIQMKEVFGIEAHDGHSPGNTDPKRPESWVGVRMTNGAIAGEANSPVFEAYALAPWTPTGANQPYLTPGRSQIIAWGKDQPTDLQVRDGNLADKLLMNLTIDGQSDPLTIGGETRALNPEKK